MKDIAIYGAGGFGREVACLIRHINEAEGPTWNIIGFFDDGKEIGFDNGYGHVLGGMSELNSYNEPLSIAIAIGTPRTLKLLVEKIDNPNIDFPNLIAPNVLFFDRESTLMGQGNIITFGCRLSCNTSLGSFNVLNGCISLGHDASLGDFNVLMPEARLSGEVKAGNLNLFGGRSFIAQQVRIGENTTIGAGSVVLRRTKDNSLYWGNPAKKLKYNIKYKYLWIRINS